MALTDKQRQQVIDWRGADNWAEDTQGMTDEEADAYAEALANTAVFQAAAALEPLVEIVAWFADTPHRVWAWITGRR